MFNLLLAEFTVIQPAFGLFFWTLLIFIIVYFALGRLAFRPIQNALKKREDDIQHSLDEAKRAREDMQNLTAENERLLAEAREERTRMLQEADQERRRMIEEAKDEARKEANKLVTNAKQDIENQRMAAITDLKNQVGIMAVTIAEKILREKLATESDQEQYVAKLVDDIDLN